MCTYAALLHREPEVALKKINALRFQREKLKMGEN